MSGGDVRAGDLVITAPPVEPVGEVEGVLETSRGRRLVVLRAFAPGSYVVLDGADVAGALGADERGLRWAVSGARPGAILAGGAYRRELGRLRPDPFPLQPPAPVPDETARRELAVALGDDPLVGADTADVAAGVLHGVAILDGWLGTVGGKVQADFLARATPGIWAVRNRLVSDEETRVCVRDALRAIPEVAEAVSSFEVDLGLVAVTLVPEAGAEVVAAALAAAGGAAGVRGATVSVAPPEHG